MITKQLVAEVLELYFDQYIINSITDLKSGAENHCVKVVLSDKAIVVRIYGHKHSYIGKRKQSDIMFELEFMRFCNKNGIPVPCLLKSKKGVFLETTGNTNIVVMEFIDGTEPSIFTDEQIRNIGTLMAKMHNIAPDFQYETERHWPGTLIDITKLKMDSMDLAKIPQKDKIQVLVNKFNNSDRRFLDDCPKGPIHGDFKYDHLKFNNDDLVGLLDFDDCRVSYFIEDIVKVILWRLGEDKNIINSDSYKYQVFLKAYEKTRKLSVHETKSLPYYFLTRFLYKLAQIVDNINLGQSELKEIDKEFVKYDDYLELYPK